MTRSLKTTLTTVVFSLALVLGLWSYSQAVGSEITICVKDNGIVHVIGSKYKRSDCKKNETLLTWNVTGPQGPKGDTGEQGPQGEKGESGTSGSQLIQGNEAYFYGQHVEDNGGGYVANAGDTITATATCPDGKTALGGGGYVHGYIPTRVVMQESYPSSETTWAVKGIVTNSFGGAPGNNPTLNARAYVICSL